MSRIVSFLKRLQRHNPLIVLHCGISATILLALVKTFSLLRVLRLLDWYKLHMQRSGASHDAEAVASAARAIVRRMPRFGVGECLIRSLVVYKILQISRPPIGGIALLLGAGKPSGDAKPPLHCWVEVAGRALGEEANPNHTFRVVYRHEMPSPAIP
jgi:hypothetical protein